MRVAAGQRMAPLTRFPGELPITFLPPRASSAGNSFYNSIAGGTALALPGDGANALAPPPRANALALEDGRPHPIVNAAGVAAPPAPLQDAEVEPADSVPGAPAGCQEPIVALAAKIMAARQQLQGDRADAKAGLISHTRR